MGNNLSGDTESRKTESDAGLHFEPVSRSNKRLIIEAQKGDEEAIAKVIELHYKDILYFSKKKLGSHDGEDVAQQVTIRIVDKIKDLKDPTKFKSWMMSTVYHECIEFMRRRKSRGDLVREVELSEETLQMIDNGEAAFDELFINADTRKQMLEIINELPENYADCIRLRYLEDLKYSEIAEILGVNEKKVKNDLHRGLKSLERQIEDKGGKSKLFAFSAGGAIPVLTEALQMEQMTLVTPEATESALALTKSHIASQQAVSSTVHASSASAVKVGIGAKIALVSVAVVATVAIGVGVSLSGNQVDEAQEQVAVEETTTTPVEVTEKEIITVADMIGEDNAALLAEFEANGADAASWQEFLEIIGAQEEDKAIEYDYRYGLYLLEKQDKQLLLAERVGADGGPIDVISRFGYIEEPPRMMAVILMFP